MLMLDPAELPQKGGTARGESHPLARYLRAEGCEKLGGCERRLVLILEELRLAGLRRRERRRGEI